MVKIAAAILGVLLMAQAVSAQETSNATTKDRLSHPLAHSFSELSLLVMPGDTVSVTTATGGDVTGKIAELSPSSLALVVKGQRRDLRESDITTIRQRRADSLQNGALVGLCVGGLLGALAGANGRGNAPTWMVVWGGIGTGIGISVDAAMVKRQVIYQRQSDGARLRLSPILTAARKGALVSIRF